MKKIVDIIRVTRPLNLGLTALSVWLGYYFSSGFYISRAAVFACFSAASICAGGNVFNDYYDKKIDQLNKPERPFAAGRLSGGEMVILGIVSFLTGITLSYFISYLCLVIAAVTILFLMIYNIWIKKVALGGNVLVSILAGATFLYGGAAGGTTQKAVIPGVFAVLYHFGREILKDIEDLEADRMSGIMTFPVLYGFERAYAVSSAVFGFLMIFTLYPYFFMDFSLFYLVTVIVGVDMVVLFLMSRFWLSKNKKHLAQMNQLLKLGMFLGMVALFMK